MANFGKWIGAGLGFALGGPLGALLGLFIGSVLGSTKTLAPNQYRRVNPASGGGGGRGDFMFSLIVLATSIMKADGRIMRSELDYVKGFLKQNFGLEATHEAMGMIKKLSDREIPLNEVCHQIRYNMDIPSKTQLLYFLFGVAKADKHVCEEEIRVLENISNRLGIGSSTFNSIKSMHYNDVQSAYQILEINSTATNEEIKKAYRKMAMANHPDKVSHLGEDIRQSAEEKFTKINAAYEQIKKQRNIN